MANTQALKTGFADLLARFGVSSGAAAPLFVRLVAAYGEPGRHYHTVGHIAHVLQVVGQLAPLTADLPAVRLAAWFHDAVYDPRRGDNEAQSAAFARRTLGPLGVPEAILDAVGRLIMATATHRPPSANPDFAVLLDADLAILGEPPAIYADYALKIRREFAWLPASAYRAGRSAVLRRFLARPTIYLTTALRASHEAQARQNLRRELADLNRAGA
jgi:predicted metal-dependent HD superfamily phosphohydrolase